MLALLLYFHTPAAPAISIGEHRDTGNVCGASRFSIPSEENLMAKEARETGTLIGSDKVEGTAVYGRDNEKIGEIERVMIEKTSGRVSYAVLGFGGFLGIGNDHYPLPWNSLKYDTDVGGYRVGVTEEQLNGAPRYASGSSWDWTDRGRTKAVDDYYAGLT